MYGKLDNNGNITFYNGFFIEDGDTVITNPTEAHLSAAGYKRVVGNDYTLNVTDAKLTVRYTDKGSYILMEHMTEDGYMGEPPEVWED